MLHSDAAVQFPWILIDLYHLEFAACKGGSIRMNLIMRP